MTTETTDHNSALASIIETGDAEDVQMILGHKDRLRCGGVIRTGIMVPKNTCTDAEKKLFKELEAQGFPYAEIDRKIGGEPKTSKTKLFPKNSDYFVVRDCDFTRPADAQYIRANYADNDGKVRRIPVWFSIGEIDRVLHHGFTAFGKPGLVAASFYDGKNLMVRYLPKGFDGAAKKTDWLTSPLDPDNPVTPAGHKLQFGGIFRFNVPGLRGFDELICCTKSWYGLSFSVALLRRVRSVLGRFDGLLNGGAFFELVKSPEDVKTPDGKTQTQHIPVLELACDPMELARYAEPSQVAARAQTALSLLTGSRPVAPAPATEPEEDDSFSGTAPDEAPEESPEPAIRDEIKPAIDALHALADKARIQWPTLRTYYAAVNNGMLIESATIEELREFHKSVTARLAKDLKATVAEIEQTAGGK